MTAPIEYLTIEQFARKLQISEAAALRVVKARKLKVLNVSQSTKRARYRIPATEIEALAIPAEIKARAISKNLPSFRRYE